MSITEIQMNNFVLAVKVGLSVLKRPLPMTPVIGAGGITGILFSLGASMVLGGVAQMLAPKARTPTAASTDNGKQNTYFSSLDNMVAQGNALPVLYGEMRVGSRVVSQEISTADEGDGGEVVVIGR